MNDVVIAAIVASPWIVPPAVTMWSVRRSRDLATVSPVVRPDAPLVSVVIPARNECRHIEACLRAILAGSYRNLEVVVVDDRSTDDTGEIARAVARDDSRVRVIDNTDPPPGWFGKPWACSTGAAAAHGEVICFTDADARHGANLVARTVNAMRDDGLDMLTVAGHQELGSFWERIVQPHVFWMLVSRYGGPERVNRSPRVEDKIANGQCIFVTRRAYDAIGGHGAVHDRVAEDLAIAQRLFAAGCRTALVFGPDELSTRMYTSLAEIMAGWRKNVFAGGREAMPWGRVGQVIFPALLVIVPLLTVLPLLVLITVLVAGGPAWLRLASSIAVVAQLVSWAAVYRWMRAPLGYVLLFPLGALVFLVIACQAMARGSRVEWKGRSYVTTSADRYTSR